MVSVWSYDVSDDVIDGDDNDDHDDDHDENHDNDDSNDDLGDNDDSHDDTNNIIYHYIPETRWFNVWATELTVKEWVTIDMFWHP